MCLTTPLRCAISRVSPYSVPRAFLVDPCPFRRGDRCNRAAAAVPPSTCWRALVVATPVARCAGAPEYVASASVPSRSTSAGSPATSPCACPPGTPGTADPLIIAYHGAARRHCSSSATRSCRVYRRSWLSPGHAQHLRTALLAGCAVLDPKADDIGFTLRSSARSAPTPASTTAGSSRSGAPTAAVWPTSSPANCPGSSPRLPWSPARSIRRITRAAPKRVPSPRIEFHGTEDRIVPYWGLQKFGSVLPPIPDEVGGWARRAGCALRSSLGSPTPPRVSTG